MAGNSRVPTAGHPDVRRGIVVACWLCGIRLTRDQMMSDGAGACDNVRWYCQDTEACTERWTSARRPEGRIAKSTRLPPPG
jgi:hypothetical protein